MTLLWYNKTSDYIQIYPWLIPKENLHNNWLPTIIILLPLNDNIYSNIKPLNNLEYSAKFLSFKVLNFKKAY